MRGQAHTLEAFAATLLLLATVIFALQATAVTPLSASTSNQHIQNQHRLMAADLLATAAENGSLREAVVDWDTTRDRWDGVRSGTFYSSGGPQNTFGHMLNRTFRDERIAFNVYVYHRDPTHERDTYDAMVYMGSSSDNAVSASRTLVLYDDTKLSSPSSFENVSEAAANDAFYAEDSSPESKLFNVLEVRIVTWRM